MRSVRLYFARRAARLAEERARALWDDVHAQIARMEAMPPGDARGMLAATIRLNILTTVDEADREVWRTRERVRRLGG